MSQTFELKPNTWMTLKYPWDQVYCILSINERELVYRKPTGLKNRKEDCTFGSIPSMVQWFNAHALELKLEIINDPLKGWIVVTPERWTVEVEPNEVES